MKKFVLVSALSLLFFYCDAQKELGKLLGVSAGYVPWGVERLECASADGLDDYTWKGRYSFKNPTLLLGFEIRNEVVSSLIELSFSSFFVDKIDSANTCLGSFNIKQIGLAYPRAFDYATSSFSDSFAGWIGIQLLFPSMGWSQDGKQPVCDFMCRSAIQVLCL